MKWTSFIPMNRIDGFPNNGPSFYSIKSSFLKYLQFLDMVTCNNDSTPSKYSYFMRHFRKTRTLNFLET